jgi:pimeloyl-ACP methyl ester carboxylesterase
MHDYRSTDSLDRLALSDGRRLQYTETGPEDGTPVIYCHGAIGTELHRSVDLETITSDLGIRYIAIMPHRTPGMQRRIRLGLAVLARKPRLCATFGDAVLPVITRHPVLLSHVISAHAARAERERLRQPEERSAASGSFLAAAAYGVRGMVEDYVTYAREWGFSASEITAEVDLWHGLADPLVPIEHALALAVTLPRCRVFFDPDEGHHFFRRRLAEILGALVARRQDAVVAMSPASAQALLARRARGRR